MSALSPPSSRIVETPSQTLISTVPFDGEGRTSQRMSLRNSMTPVRISSSTNDSYSSQVWNWNGSPAVGSCWNIIARLLA
jgi:hypothetical protein